MNSLTEQSLSIDGMSQSANGRLKNTLSSSRLGIFDRGDTRPVQLMQEVSKDLVNFSTASLEYLRVMLGNTAYIQGIDAEGLKRMTLRASRGEAENQPMVFRTVFGASEIMPLRGLSYLFPSIHLAERMDELGENRRLFPTRPDLPNIQFVFMTNAGSEVEIFRQAQFETTQFIRVAQAYIQKFHPKLAGRISFVDDSGFTQNILNQADFHRFANTLYDRLPADIGQKLLSMGNGKSTADKSAIYGAMHVFVHEGFFPDFDFRVRSGEKIDLSGALLVSFGGAPEKIFHAIRKTLRPEARRVEQFHFLDTAQYITKHTVPPYMLLPQYDLPLGEVLKNPERISQALNGKGEDGVHTVVRKELQLLSADAGNTNEFIDFLHSMNH